MPDWTMKNGRWNTSDSIQGLITVTEAALRRSGDALVNGGAGYVAGALIGELVGDHGLRPVAIKRGDWMEEAAKVAEAIILASGVYIMTGRLRALASVIVIRLAVQELLAPRLHLAKRPHTV